MSLVISEKRLVNSLERLKKAQSLWEQAGCKVIFLNIEGFYKYFEDLRQRDIREIFSDVEPFIPLTVTQENVQMLLEAAVSNDERLTKEIEQNLLDNSKVQFVNAMVRVKENQWDDVIEMCKDIRNYIEQGI